MLTFQEINEQIKSSKLFAAAKLIRELDPSAQVMKTQKLLYYVQGWSLALTGDPMLDAAPQAYRDGPVYPHVREDLIYNGGHEVDAASVDVLSNQDKEIIFAVVKRYRNSTGRQMADGTHQEAPWQEARGNLPTNASCDDAISLQTMMRHFLAVAPADVLQVNSDVVGRKWREPDNSFFDRETGKWEELLERLSA